MGESLRTGMKRVVQKNFRLSDAEAAEVAALAQVLDVRESDLIREAVRQFISTHRAAIGFVVTKMRTDRPLMVTLSSIETTAKPDEAARERV